jgi:hypothetical protein
MRDRRRRISAPRRTPAGHRVHGLRLDHPRLVRRTPMRPNRFRGDLDPPREIPCLVAGGLLPLDVHRPQEPEPPKQIHPIRPLRRRRPTGGLQLAEERGGRAHRLARRVEQPIRLPRITRRGQSPDPRYYQRRQISWSVPQSRHETEPNHTPWPRVRRITLGPRVVQSTHRSRGCGCSSTGVRARGWRVGARSCSARGWRGHDSGW